MSFEYVLMGILIYILVRLWRYHISKDEHTSTKWITRIAMIFIVQFIYNTLAANRFDFIEAWKWFEPMLKIKQ